MAAAKPKIEINGGNETLRDNIKHFLPVYDEACDTPPWRLRSLLRDSERQIKAAAEAVGYYHLTVDPQLTMTDDCWNMVVNVTPGPPVVIADVRISINGEGTEDKGFRKIQDRPGINVGDRLNHGTYESLKSRFTTLAASRGYFDGKFERSRVAVDVTKNTAVIELVYNTGVRYRIGEITLQQDILRDELVERYINFHEGDYYDSEKLLELKNLYNSSNFFSTASIAPDLQHLSDGKVPITVTLDERKRHSYSVGLGYATDTGPRVLLGFEDRYVNKRGHSITADLNAAEKNTTFEAAYSIPMERPAHEYLKFFYGYEYDIRSDYSEVNSIGSKYTLYSSSEWLYTFALAYEIEDSAKGDAEKERSNLLLPSVSASRVSSDGNISYPLRGWSLLTKLSGSPESLGSTSSFLQLYGRVKYIHPLLKGRLLLRGEVGSTFGEDAAGLPVSLTYYAGGDASVRGYDYNSLGPTDDEGNVIGGGNLLVTSIEYDYLFKPKWAVAVFYDQGNAGNDWNFALKRGTGLGIRWISPIGPVRIDVAKALDDEKGWALHLSMGPDL